MKIKGKSNYFMIKKIRVMEVCIMEVQLHSLWEIVLAYNNYLTRVLCKWIKILMNYFCKHNPNCVSLGAWFSQRVGSETKLNRNSRILLPKHEWSLRPLPPAPLTMDGGDSQRVFMFGGDSTISIWYRIGIAPNTGASFWWQFLLFVHSLCKMRRIDG